MLRIDIGQPSIHYEKAPPRSDSFPFAFVVTQSLIRLVSKHIRNFNIKLRNKSKNAIHLDDLHGFTFALCPMCALIICLSDCRLFLLFSPMFQSSFLMTLMGFVINLQSQQIQKVSLQN